MPKNHVFGSLNLNNSEIFMLSFEDIFLGTLDTYTKKMNPPSVVLGAGVHSKVCWLIAYLFNEQSSIFIRCYCFYANMICNNTENSRIMADTYSHNLKNQPKSKLNFKERTIIIEITLSIVGLKPKIKLRN